MKKHNLNENFICRIWENETFYSDLKTINGESIEILDIGKRNFDAGPDFLNSRIKIGNQLYQGAVEIHKSVKDWYSHKHDADGKYNEVILHVVFYKDENYDDESDKPVSKNSRPIPTLILSEFISRPIKEIWNEIILNPSESFLLPCYPKIKDIPQIIINDFLKKLSKDRILMKTERLNERLLKKSGSNPSRIDWEQLLFEFICEALGYSKNKNQFLKMAESADIVKLKKMKTDILHTDSALFGISGFLDEQIHKNEYVINLKSIWNEQRDYLKPELMVKSEWNFFRLRPANFPTLRIAYASAVLNEILNNELFRKIIIMFEDSISVINDLKLLFKNLKISDFWNSHYNFNKSSAKKINAIGMERIGDIISNVILPLVLLYSRIYNKENIRERVMYLFRKEKIISRGNEIVTKMKEQTGKSINTISEEQALIQLHNFYCVESLCSECEIGKIIFEKKNIKEPMKIIIY